MSLFSKSFPTNNSSKLTTPNKITTLNPNAAEFVPSTLRSPATVSPYSKNPTRFEASGASSKPILDRSESSVSNASDDEAHQYWRHQLPDDITPDFKLIRDEDLQGPGGLSLAELSINGVENSRFSAIGGGHFLTGREEMSSDISLAEKLRQSGPSFLGDSSADALTSATSNPWEKQFMNGGQDMPSGIGEGRTFNGDLTSSFMNELFRENVVLDENGAKPIEFLASQFPGFAAESLADVYYANACDLNLTIEMLTQLELQDGGFSQTLNSKTLSAPNLSALDFPALSVSDSRSSLQKFAEDGLQQVSNQFQSVDKDNLLLFKTTFSSATPSRTTDFASAVRKLASSGASQWKYERNGSGDVTIGISRNSSLRGNLNRYGKSAYGGDRLQSGGASRVTPVWLETGESVANMYSELREEALDHARLRNACFEQARQAYLIGNKALAKELSVKGQLHNMQMKAAHGKARDSIFRQRNPLSAEPRDQAPMIDLHGLHVSEAIDMLKHELNVLRSTARSAGQRLQVMICVGTGHHTKGARTPARLPIAVEKYLLEEGLDYTQPQPGLLRVLIY